MLMAFIMHSKKNDVKKCFLQLYYLLLKRIRERIKEIVPWLGLRSVVKEGFVCFFSNCIGNKACHMCIKEKDDDHGD